MSFLYYFKDCPTCKNHNRNLVRNCALQAGVQVDEHYVFALPDIWGKDVERLAVDGAKVPFLYNTVTNTFLNVDYQQEDMANVIKAFFDK